jgi:pyruvate dehydrogenase E2 component (dihydrolipoamide acetyltransferase)
VQGAVGQATGQVGQAAQGAQDAAGGAAQQATSGASRKAEELGVDLSEVEGTGPDGRITLRDVKRAAEQG